MKYILPQGQDERIDRYTRYTLLRDGKHEQAFQNIINKYGHTYKSDAKLQMPSRFISVNLPKEITRIGADLMFDEKPQVKAGENTEWVQLAWEELQLSRILYESVDYAGARGDAILRIRVEDKELYVDAIDPSMYKPIYDDGVETGQPDAQELWTQTTIQQGDTIIPVSLVETYRDGVLTYRLTDGSKEYRVEDYFPEYAEPIDLKLAGDEQLIIHIKNSGSPISIWGTSDYSDIEGLIYEVDNRTSRIAAILDKHSSPKLKAPKGTMDNLKKGGEFDIFEYMPQNGDVSIEYLSWDGQLVAAFQHLESTIDLMLQIANITPAMVGRDKVGGGAESGRALKFKLIRTLAMKHRKEMYWSLAIRQLLWTLQVLSSQNGYTIAGERSQEPVYPTVEFSDSIIMDEVERIENIERQLGAGLISKVEAMQNFHNIEEEIAQARLERINSERTRQSAFTMPELIDM